MAVIMWFSSDIGSAEHSEPWLAAILRALAPWVTPSQLAALHILARKAAHLTEYAILAALWFRALVRGRGSSPRSAAWISLAISLGWAGLDEAHQSLVPSRRGSVADVAIDGTGAMAAVVVARLGWRRAADLATTFLLWVALAGGGLFLILNAVAGVSSGPLWLTVPASALVLMLRYMHARSPRARPMHARNQLDRSKF
jgi:VanZ family protein